MFKLSRSQASKEDASLILDVDGHVPIMRLFSDESQASRQSVPETSRRVETAAFDVLSQLCSQSKGRNVVVHAAELDECLSYATHLISSMFSPATPLVEDELENDDNNSDDNSDSDDNNEPNLNQQIESDDDAEAEPDSDDAEQVQRSSRVSKPVSWYQPSMNNKDYNESNFITQVLHHASYGTEFALMMAKVIMHCRDRTTNAERAASFAKRGLMTRRC